MLAPGRPPTADTAWKFATDIDATWSFKQDLMFADRADVTQDSWTRLTARMTPHAAKNWKRLFAKAKKDPDGADDENIMAPALWGYGPQPGVPQAVREVSITGSMRDWGKYGTQVVKTVLYSTRDETGQMMQSPYTKTVTLYLTGSSRSWQIDNWSANWKVGKTVPAT